MFALLNSWQIKNILHSFILYILHVIHVEADLFAFISVLRQFNLIQTITTA